MDPDLTSRRASRVAFDVAAVAAGSDGARASRLRGRPRPNRVVDDDGDDVAREAGCAVVASVEFRDARVEDDGVEFRDARVEDDGVEFRDARHRRRRR